MRRRAVVVSVLVVLAGCGGDSDSEEAASTPQRPAGTATASTQPAAEPLEIVVQRGVGGARIGMSETDVRQQLGDPVRSETLRNAQGPYTEFTYPRQFTVAFQRGANLPATFTGGASSFYLKEASARTPAGVGVGSTQAEVRARVPGAKCDRAFGPLTCHVGAGRRGSTVTQFGIAQGRVSFVRIALTS